MLRGPTLFPRGQYSTSFASLASQDAAVQEDYKNGIVALSCFVGGFFVLWGLILIYLMIKGKSVGCASGRAFEITPIDKQSHSSKHKRQHSSSQSSISSQDDATGSKKMQHEEAVGLETESFSSSLCSFDASSGLDAASSIGDSTEDTVSRVESSRAARTRMVFLIFACIVLVFVPLALAFAFAPMKESAKTLEGSVAVRTIGTFSGYYLQLWIRLCLTNPTYLYNPLQGIEHVLLEVRAALQTVKTASQSITGILSQTSINSTTFCPNINSTQFRNRNLDVNLQALADILTLHYVQLNINITDNMVELHNLLDTVEDVTVIAQGSFDQAEGFIWLVPGLLLGVSIVTALATFGVILAWKRDAGMGLQRCMSYGVLPVLVALCVMCIVLGCAATASTAVSAGE